MVVQYGVEVVVYGVDVVYGVVGVVGYVVSVFGMLQLDFIIFGNQIFWLFVVLVVIYWVLLCVVLLWIGGVISDCQGVIIGDFMVVEEFKQKVKDVEVVYDKVLIDVWVEVSKIVVVNKVEIQKEFDVVIVYVDVEILVCVVEFEKCIGEICVLVVEDVCSVVCEVIEVLV